MQCEFYCYYVEIRALQIQFSRYARYDVWYSNMGWGYGIAASNNHLHLISFHLTHCTFTARLWWAFELCHQIRLSAGIQSAGDSIPETLVRILHSAEEDNLSTFDSKIACLCQSIKINDSKHIYHQSQVRKPTGCGVEWTEVLLTIGTGYWVACARASKLATNICICMHACMYIWDDIYIYMDIVIDRWMHVYYICIYSRYIHLPLLKNPHN